MKQRKFHGNGRKRSMTGRIEAASYVKYRQQLDICLQMSLDAALIALDDVFDDLSAEKAIEFRGKYIEAMNEMSRLLAADGKDDADLTYSTETIDRRLRQIVGESNFVEWEKRYGG